MDPITMAIGGGLSLAQGIGARQAAKSQAKRQAANDMIANQINKARQDEVNAINKNLGKRLLKEKEVTTEKGTVTTEHQESSVINTAQDNYSYVDVDSMMDAAERAGFNPVTWLNAGGMQAYTQTGSRGTTEMSASSKDTVTTDMTTTRKGHNAAAAYNLMSPEAAHYTSSQATYIPSVTEAVAKAGQTAFDIYRQDTSKKDSQDFQRELLNLQIGAIQDARKGGGATVNTGTPSYTTSGSTKTGGGATSMTGGLSGSGGGSVSGNTGTGKDIIDDVNKTGMDPQKVETINPWQRVFGGKLKSDPDWPSGQSVEDELGETPWTWVYPPFKKANDLYYTFKGKGIDDSIMETWEEIKKAQGGAPLGIIRVKPSSIYSERMPGAN